VRAPSWTVSIVASVLAVACAPSLPPRWATGGAPLTLAAARWERGAEDVVEVTPDGRVLEGGDLVFVIDRVGRAVDDDYEAVALLFPQGELMGAGGSSLGHVGYRNAAPPGAHTAWLSVLPDGQVRYFDFDGEAHAGGFWKGCEAAVVRTCTLVTHLFALRSYQRQVSGRVNVGIGLGWYY
jgi:hypothetical protein